METATIRDVQHNLAAYVRRVEQGEHIDIRRRSRIVARLVPAGESVKPANCPNWGELREWRRKVWGGKPVPGKPGSQIVYESRGDR
jgi:antitoxin (DNA-binding transcriptional repressor) of toxin-antitoxin stability system